MLILQVNRSIILGKNCCHLANQPAQLRQNRRFPHLHQNRHYSFRLAALRCIEDTG